jgi:O-methyltransferase
MRYRIYHGIRKWLARVNLGFMLLSFPRDFEQDGLATSRIRPFSEDVDFEDAKRETVNMIGMDFQIDWRSHVFLWAFGSTLLLPGVAVELGTGKGWMFTMAFNHRKIPTLGDVILIDRFSIWSVDKVTGQPQVGHKNDVYSSDLEALLERFSDERGVRIVKGDLPGVLNEIDLRAKAIRFIHVDLNAAKPEVDSLKVLWANLLPGAIVLLDDFGSPEFVESNLAMRELATELDFQILGLPTGQGLIIKR